MQIDQRVRNRQIATIKKAGMPVLLSEEKKTLKQRMLQVINGDIFKNGSVNPLGKCTINIQHRTEETQNA